MIRDTGPYREDVASSGGPLSGESRWRSATSTMLKHPWWLGLTGIVTAAALVVGLLQLNDPDPAPPSSPSSNPSAPVGVSGEISGDCNAIGSSNNVDCSYKVYPPAPASIGEVKIGWAGYATFFFAGKPSELPTPPDYPPPEVRSHCDEWDEWLSTNERIYTMQPQVWMSMLSGQNDQVVVTGVEPTVFKKRPIDDGDFTVIQCQYGADGVPGSIVTVDVGTGEAHLLDQTKEDSKPAPMPPAALVVNGSGYDGAIVRVGSSTGFLYSGRLTVTAQINGKEREIEFGTPERPFRWVGGPPELYPQMQGDTRYDWNPTTKQWVANLDVNEVYPQ